MAERLIRFVPYEPCHLAALEGLSPALAQYRDRVLADAEALGRLGAGRAWSGMAGERIVGCAGVQDQEHGRAVAWALFGAVPRRAWPTILAKARAELDAAASRWPRIEAHVVYGFGAGCRLVHALGFEVEALMRRYADGRDFFLYARVRGP